MKKHQRTIFFATLSVPYNVVMALGKIILGIVSSSFFLGINAMYNIGMGLIKYFAIKVDKANKNGVLNEVESLKKQNDFFMIAGGILLVTSISYILYCIRMFLGEHTMDYSPIVAITIATITFTEIAIAIRGVVVTRKDKKPVIMAIKLTNLAASLICLVLTQTAIMSFSHEGDASYYNGLSGMIFGSVAALIGILMVIRGAWVAKSKTKNNNLLSEDAAKL